MADDILKNIPLPADLPENWTSDQTVAPTGAEVGMDEQHGYNYLMQQVNNTQKAATALNAGKLSLSGGTLTGPLILEDGYNAYGIASNAAAHNVAPPRFKNLGTAPTPEMLAAIKAGTFDDLFVGDYWIINGIKFFIADFNYWLFSGDKTCTTNHAVILPGKIFYSSVMNSDASTSSGYIGSYMYKTGLKSAENSIAEAFGSEHLLTHRERFSNAAVDGHIEGTAWVDNTVTLMSESMVYGGRQISIGGNDYSVDFSQLSIFRSNMIRSIGHENFWLRDITGPRSFAFVTDTKTANSSPANSTMGVLPVFGLIG